MLVGALAYCVVGQAPLVSVSTMARPTVEDTGKKLDHLNALISRIEGIFTRRYDFEGWILLPAETFPTYFSLRFARDAKGEGGFVLIERNNDLRHPLRDTPSTTRIAVVCGGYITALQDKLDEHLKERYDGVDKAVATADALIAELERER